MHPRNSICILVILMAALICDLTTALPSARVKRQNAAISAAAATNLEEPQTNELNPINSQDGDLSDVDRNKRKVPEAAFEAKNAVLGFVFGKNKHKKTESIRSGRAVEVNKKDDDVPVFDRERVSLDIPDRLFSQSFSTLTNVSKVASNFIMNTARRYARFVLFFKPLFGDSLKIEGYNPPTSTTESP